MTKTTNDEVRVTDEDVREWLVQVVLSHVPVLGVSGTGKVFGCRCMDRVFVRGQETWAEHLSGSLLAAFPALSRPAAPEPEWEIVVLGKEVAGDSAKNWELTVWKPEEIEQARRDFPGSEYKLARMVLGPLLAGGSDHE